MTDWKARIKEALRPIVAELIDECFNEVIEEAIGEVLTNAPSLAPKGDKPVKPTKIRGSHSPESPAPAPAAVAVQAVVSEEGASLVDRMEAVQAERDAAEAVVQLVKEAPPFEVVTPPAATGEQVTVAMVHALIAERPDARLPLQKFLAEEGVSTLRGVEPGDEKLTRAWFKLQDHLAA